jgi:hypothetical protein
MRKRKLQIFLSSTYEDLINERLAAMEAILAAGHIPAAMEQFAPGDETAWEKITTWIDESDAFILILGGRYGSIEPTTGKSYVQLEYEYVIEKKKPFFALVVTQEHHEQRVKDFGLGKVDERENQQSYKEFRNVVKQRLCSFWNDKKDIKAAIFQKLPEWAQRGELIGWVRGDEAAKPEVMNELARLSQENHELRAKAASDTFDGLTYDELIRYLEQHKIDSADTLMEHSFHIAPDRLVHVDNLLGFFDAVFEKLAAGKEVLKNNALYPIFNTLVGFGLLGQQRIESTPGLLLYSITESGRRFRNRRLAHASGIGINH